MLKSKLSWKPVNLHFKNSRSQITAVEPKLFFKRTVIYSGDIMFAGYWQNSSSCDDWETWSSRVKQVRKFYIYVLNLIAQSHYGNMEFTLVHFFSEIQDNYFNILQILYHHYKCQAAWKIISGLLLSSDSWNFGSVNFPVFMII